VSDPDEQEQAEQGGAMREGAGRVDSSRTIVSSGEIL
jgi:hypothetical protein